MRTQAISRKGPQAYDQSSSPVRWLVVDAGAITGADYSAGRALAELRQGLEKAGVVLAIARVGTNLREDLDSLSLIGMIGAHRIFRTRGGCLEAYRLEKAAPE